MQNQNPTRGGLPMPQGLSLPEKVIEHITLTDSALTKAAAMEKTAAAKTAQVEALIPSAVATMLKFDRIQANQQEKLAEMLRDPAKAMELLIKVAGHRNTEEIARLGVGVDNGTVKTAGANGRPAYNPASSLTNPNVGARTTMLKQSSVSLFRGLGLNIPSEN